VFNTAAFAHPVNEYSYSGRGIVTSTPYPNFDFSLMKAVSIEELLKVQFGRSSSTFSTFKTTVYQGPHTGRAASEWSEGWDHEQD
jgi:hypothetical protein